MSDDQPQDLAETVRGIWREVLSLDDETFDDDDNFFDLGGHSMLAVTFLTRMEEVTGIAVPLEDIFTDGRLSQILQTCRAHSGS